MVNGAAPRLAPRSPIAGSAAARIAVRSARSISSDAVRKSQASTSSDFATPAAASPSNISPAWAASAANRGWSNRAPSRSAANPGETGSGVPSALITVLRIATA